MSKANSVDTDIDPFLEVFKDVFSLAGAPEVILGSSSPRRHRILSVMNVPHKVVSADAEESLFPFDAVRTVLGNARAKHMMCMKNFPGRWIITADTIVEFGGCCLGKPANMDEAFRMLTDYSGKSQHVFTAVAFSKPGMSAPEIRVEGSSVAFKMISASIAREYLRLVEDPLGRAGAYDIDSFREMIIESFNGSYTNVMGLPAETVSNWLIANNYAKSQKQE